MGRPVMESPVLGGLILGGSILGGPVKGDPLFSEVSCLLLPWLVTDERATFSACRAENRPETNRARGLPLHEALAECTLLDLCPNLLLLEVCRLSDCSGDNEKYHSKSKKLPLLIWLQNLHFRQGLSMSKS